MITTLYEVTIYHDNYTIYLYEVTIYHNNHTTNIRAADKSYL